MVNAFSQRFAIIALGAFCASDAMASHFEFCWLTGSVEALGERTEVDQYFELRVTSSEPAGNGSVVACVATNRRLGDTRLTDWFWLEPAAWVINC